MRRLVAVFSGKRSDKSEGSVASTADHGSATAASIKSKSSKSRSGLFRSLTKGSTKEADAKARKRHPMPPVSTLPDHAASSASSSSGGPTTPSDDHESVGHHGHPRKGWASLLPDKTPFVPAILSPPPNLQPRPYQPHNYDQDTASVDSKSDSGDEGPLLPRTSLSASPPLSPAAFFRVITTNALALPFSPPPLLFVPNSPSYPRSSNLSRQLAPSDSLRVRMHRQRLLSQLDVTDQRALAGFSQRRGVPANSKRLSLVLDDVAVRKSHQVRPFSQGLRRWAERPCFEDRVIIYLPSQDELSDVRYERVTSAKAVEALGYSEELELLAALDEVQVEGTPFSVVTTPPTPDLPLTPSTASLSSMPPSPVMTGSTSSLPNPNTKTLLNGPYKTAAPSPLRNGSTESSLGSSSRPAIAATSRSMSSPALDVPASLVPGVRPSRTSPALSPSPSAPQASSRPAVHFAEDDKDESIPLDYVMRIKQARDQKAKFLASERARRIEQQARGDAAKRAQDDKRKLAEERRRLEEARRKHEEERRRQELERKKWEQERAQWEKERRVAEEEKKQRIAKEELAEARKRREGYRAGPAPSRNDGPVSWAGDREKEREKQAQEARGSYTRARYDDTLPVTKRQSSEPINTMSSSPSSRPGIPFANSSPGSSRPPSIAGSQRGSSRPPSMYSTPPSSASDVRVRRESKAGSRRASIVSDGSYMQSPMFLPPGTPPMMMHPWMVPPVPPLPMMPNAVPMMAVPMVAMPYTDMPLLPPAAPFMMQQFGGRNHGQRSHSSSPTRAQGSSSERGSGSAHGRESPSSRHSRRASGEVSVVTSNGRASYPPAPSSPALRSGRTGHPGQQQQPQKSQSSSKLSPPEPAPFHRPIPVSTASWGREPGFQNLSRAQQQRRQTMIT